VLSDRC